MVQQIFHLVLALNVIWNAKVQAQCLIRRYDDVLALNRRHAPQLVFAVVNMHGEHAVRLRLELVLPLSPLSIFPNAVRKVEQKRACNMSAAGTTMSVVRWLSPGSGRLIAMVAIICTVFPKPISSLNHKYALRR